MKPDRTKVIRCAIYTRVSTEHGLEQDFNSLNAQREASEAFTKSQAHEGWRLMPAHYDDGGFSGGSLERPALQKLLEEVRARRIDVIVVYKVDRLTRSLADFAKLVELFDQHGVSFVSVTQAFNNTNSMGRLTLNVLLSFAQFEREVTGERIRDKIAASKRKGIWMGGTVPLGYRVEARKLLIEEDEAAIVRMIFQRYLDLGSLPALQRELRESGILTRARLLSSGQVRGGVSFTNGPLSHLLKNRVYLGEMNHKGKSWPGDHKAIIDPDLFEAVQRKLAENLNDHHGRRSKSEALLLGRIFDDRGNRMTPSHARKGAARYRYYTSSFLAQGRREDAGSVARVPAPDVERVVVESIRSRVAEIVRATRLYGSAPLGRWSEAAELDDRALVQAILRRVTIRQGTIELTLANHEDSSDERRVGDLDQHDASDAAAYALSTILIPWTAPSFRRRRDLIAPAAPNIASKRPMRPEVRANILRAIARATEWRDRLISGAIQGTEAIAKREGCSERSARMILSLAFLAPDIVQAVVDGRLPRGIGLTTLSDLPIDWSQQRQVLGIQSASRPAV